MTSVALHKMLVKRAEQAGLTNISWHDFRRTFAGELLDMGEDISTVSQLMGHSNVSTTARYDRRPEAAREKAAKKISVPFFG
jgi:site-specific recombinase XerD